MAMALHYTHTLWNAVSVGNMDTVADPGGVRGVQMHPPLAASNVFLRT